MTPDDPLEPYRRKPVLVVAHAADEDLPPYEALTLKNRARSFKIACKDGIGYNFPYHYLGCFLMDDLRQEALHITAGGFSFRLRGRFLDAIELALAAQHCGIVREFDPGRYQPPTDTQAAFVESIEVKLLRGNAADVESVRPA